MGATRRTRRGQRGFALLTVLAVIAVTAVVFGALLGLMLLTIKITSNHQKIERERRAADGAVVATLNHLRLGTPGAGCGEVPGTLPGYALEFDLPAASDTVEVTCRAGVDELGEPAGEVKIVGDRYSGELTDWRSAWPWAQVSGGALAALGAGGVEPSLVHTGPEPLRFNGHVNTKTGAAALRVPTDGTPAIEVRGQYRQGAPGLGAAGTDCGLLGQPGSPMFIDTVADRSCGDPSLLSDANPADYAIDPTVPALPAVGGDGCPAGPVVTFAPGRYDRHAVATLNRWFDGSCRNRTFHFPSGIYWFDASDPTMPAGDRNALVIDDDTSAFVFGQPRGWDASTGATPADFPDACDASVTSAAPGGSIVLSGRTSLQHRGGRLAVCPYVSPEGRPYPAILQQRTIPTAITVSAGAEKDFKPAANLVSGDAGRPTNAVSTGCTVGGGQTSCTSTRTFEILLGTSGGPEPLRSLRISVVGDEPNYPVSAVQKRTMRFTVQAADSTTCESAAFDGAPLNGNETSFDLLSGSCAGAGLTAEKLDGATVTAKIQYQYKLPFCLSLWGCPIERPQTVVIWDVRAVADPWTASASSVADSSGWRNAANALDDDASGNVTVRLPCGEDSCLTSPEALAGGNSFTLAGVALGDPVDPGDEIDSLGVVIKQQGPQVGNVFGIEFGSLVLRGTTEVGIELADGTVCSKRFEGVQNRVGATYYPLMINGSSQCDSGLVPGQSTASLLDGASLSVKVTLDCYGEEYGLCGVVRPVPIQYVGLVATSNSYKGDVTRSALTIDSTDGGAGSSANFFGAGHMPNSSLDLYWNGAPSGATLFGGELQLSSLGSRMLPDARADIVCCTRPDTSAYEVRLTAHVAGRPVISVVAMLAPDRGMPEILEWTQCGRNGACDPGD